MFRQHRNCTTFSVSRQAPQVILCLFYYYAKHFPHRNGQTKHERTKHMIGQTTRLQTESRPRMKTDGLTNAEADESRIQNGTNELTKRPHKSFFRRLLENFGDPIIRILLGAMVLNILLSLRDVNWPETIGIAVAVLTATLVSTISEAGSERAFEKLSSDDNGKVYKVRRDGIPSDTPLGRIVKNDIVLLTPGMMIPADGLVLSGRLKVDQSALTGEGEAVDKAPCGMSYGEKTPGNPHFVFRGALITEGEGEMLVTDVGDSTFYGKIAAELQSEELPSPLKERLRVLAGNVSKIGYVAAALVAVAYLLKGFVLDAGFDTVGMLSRLKDVRYVASELLGALTIAVSVIGRTAHDDHGNSLLQYEKDASLRRARPAARRDRNGRQHEHSFHRQNGNADDGKNADHFDHHGRWHIS